MRTAFALLVSCAAQAAYAQTPPPQNTPPVVTERVEVVATRLPEIPAEVPAGIEVITGEQLRARGATDLAAALALAAGVNITMGGDNGPASAVPEFWGLREFDAFLLVVDGIPYGGAFNPALSTLSLRDVERIEILRGAAPVTFGATSFVGVIHVVHKPGSERSRYASVRAGAPGSGGGGVDVPVALGSWATRLSVDADHQGFSEDRTSFDRAHAQWRGERGGSGHRTWFNADLAWVNQSPVTATPREGAELAPIIPVDANYNPDGAFLDDHRATFWFGLDRPAAGGTWTTLSSFGVSNRDMFRGFLESVSDTPGNATGFREQIHQIDLYVDSHLTWPRHRGVQLVAGGDFLHGTGEAKGATFIYTAPLAATTAPSVPLRDDLPIGKDDRREFFGGYVMTEWDATSRVRLSGGLRLNVTFEEREGEAGQPEVAGEKPANQTNVRPSGTVGAMVTAWQAGSDYVRVYANYRDTFKPAAVDFGLVEEDGGEEALLKPETSRSYEGGVKARSWDGRAGIEASVFFMDFNNLVVATSVNGLPELANAGKERFKGFEVASDIELPRHVLARATYSFHSARFRDFEQLFDGVPTQLAGNRLEMSPNHLFAAGLVYAPDQGLTANAEVSYIGSRYLNRRNTALAEAYTTLSLGGGCRFGRMEARVDGRNLTDTRPPVTESELGDAQYYRLFGRHVDVTLAFRF